MRYLARLPEELLNEHVRKVRDLMEDMVISSQIFIDRQIARFVGLFHDIGKYTKYFQKHLIEGKSFGGKEQHAFISSLIAYRFLKDTHPQENPKILLSTFIAIRHHHSNPQNIETELNDTEPVWYQNARNIKDQLDPMSNAVDEIEKYFPKGTIDAISELKNTEVLNKAREELQDIIMFNKDISLYFTTNLLLGMLVDADIRAVIRMDANEKRREIPEDIVDRYLEILPKNSPIDPLRQEFYKTVIDNIQRLGLENKFLSLTAPTGIGKTLAGFSAAMKLRNMIQKETGRLPRIIYVLPFTSIIDQNFEVIKKVFDFAGIGDGVLLKHHFRASPSQSTKGIRAEDVWESLEETAILRNRKGDDLLKRYEQAHTRVETWDGEVVITTFVRFY